MSLTEKHHIHLVIITTFYAWNKFIHSLMSLLKWPNFHGLMVMLLTGFHCTSIIHMYIAAQLVSFRFGSSFSVNKVHLSSCSFGLKGLKRL